MSHEAEQSTLGGLMLDNSKIHDISLAPEDFMDPKHQHIYQAIQAIIGEGGVADVITVAEWIERNYNSDATTMSYIGDLSLTTPSAVRVPAYARIVKSDARRRQALGILHEGIEQMNEEGTGAIDRVIADLMHLVDGARRYETTMQDAIIRAVDRLEFMENNPGLIGLSTGLMDLDAFLGGLQPSDLYVIGARPSMGKAQPLDAGVKTKTGWKSMRNIEIGDDLASMDGRPSIVTGIFPQGVMEVFEIEFADGRKVSATGDHLWEVQHRQWRDKKILTTKAIIERLDRGTNYRRMSVPLTPGDFGHDQSLTVDPWVLGFLIGDGNFTDHTPRFSTDDGEVVERIRADLPDGYRLVSCGKYDYRISGKKWHKNIYAEKLRALNLWGKYSHEKHIPLEYLLANKKARFEMMRGLMDSDGWVEKHGSLCFATTSKQLADDFQELAWSLGAICTVRRRENGHKGFYSFVIQHRFPSEFLWLPRKKNRAKTIVRRLRLPIVSVKKTGEEECQCIMVSHARSLYLTDGYVATHNTALMLNMALSAEKPIGIFSAEQPMVQVGQRVIAISGGASTSNMRQAKMEKKDWDAVSTTLKNLTNRVIMVNDRSAPTLVDVVRQTRKWKREHNIQGIYLDYIQRMRGPKGMKRHEQVEEIVRGLKELAKELDIPVLALSQVNREVEKRKDRRPHMADLRDSGAIEQEADNVMMLYRDEVYDENTRHKGIAELNIEKNRHGRTGFITIEWNAEQMVFQDMKTSNLDEQNT